MTQPVSILVMALLALAPLAAPPATAQEGTPLHRRYDFARPTGRTTLPVAVGEASGLTFTRDRAHLLVHGDEEGLVVVLDRETGRETRRFTVGRTAVQNDFEGIASVGERLFLASSTGLLYEFREPGPGTASAFRITDTRLGRTCEVEGLGHDPVDRVLLVACKTVSGPEDHAVVHRVPPAPWDAVPPALLVSVEELKGFGVRPRLHPSAVAVDAGASTILLLAAREELLVEVERSGRIRSVVQLPDARHPQAEGLAVGADGTLYLADEGQGGEPAHLTWYAPVATPGTGAHAGSPRRSGSRPGGGP